MENKKRDPKIKLYAIVLILVAASIAFRLLNDWKLEQTSLLFIGIPALIALLVIKHTNRPKTSYAVMFYVVSIFLLLCGVLLGEGLICIIIMSPLFYGVGAIIIAIKNYLIRKDKQNLNAFILIPLLLLASQLYEINTTLEIHKISSTILIDRITYLSEMNASPNFTKNLPSFFKIGFPKPVGITGQGIAVGDTRAIQFLSNTKGLGDLTLKIKEATPTSIVFEVMSDKTHIAHWLSYKEITVTQNKKDNNTEITWTTDFTCDLGPSWYFEPLEKAAIELMNEHLIRSYFQK